MTDPQQPHPVPPPPAPTGYPAPPVAPLAFAQPFSPPGTPAHPSDPATLVPVVEGKDAEEVIAQIDALSDSCVGASRAGANGARAKLDFIKRPILEGTTVYIASAQQRIADLLNGTGKCTVFRTR